RRQNSSQPSAWSREQTFLPALLRLPPPALLRFQRFRLDRFRLLPRLLFPTLPVRSEIQPLNPFPLRLFPPEPKRFRFRLPFQQQVRFQVRKPFQFLLSPPVQFRARPILQPILG